MLDHEQTFKGQPGGTSMPLYDFKCPNCGLEFEVSRPMSRASEPAVCPKDSTPSERLWRGTKGIRGKRPGERGGGGKGGGRGVCGGGARAGAPPPGHDAHSFKISSR